MNYFDQHSLALRFKTRLRHHLDCAGSRIVTALLLCAALTITAVAQPTQQQAQQPTQQQANQQTKQQPPPAQQPPKPPSPKDRHLTFSQRERVTLSDINTDVVADKRVIVMMAALNMAGYDYESGNRPLSGLRQQLREDLKSINPALVRKLRDHFLAHSKGKIDAASVAPYLSLALTLTD